MGVWSWFKDTAKDLTGIGVSHEYERLSEAVRMKNDKEGVAKIKELIKAGANVNVTGGDTGDTPLHLAAARANIEAMKVLIAAGANVNAADSHGRTPMHYAALYGGAEAIKVLAQHGSDVHAKDQLVELEPIHLATVSENLQPRSSTEAINALVELGANVNAVDKYGNTPLHEAVDNFNANAIKALAAHGADMNAKNNEGVTPVYMSVMKGHGEMVKPLIQGGADINAQDNYGRTPLDRVMQNGQFRVAQILVENGGELAEMKESGCAPFIDAYRATLKGNEGADEKQPLSNSNLQVMLKDKSQGVVEGQNSDQDRARKEIADSLSR